MDNEKMRFELDKRNKLNRIMQKRVIMISFVIAVAFIIAYVVTLLISSGWFSSREIVQPSRYDFYDGEADFNEPEYMELITPYLISYCNEDYGITKYLPEEEYSRNGEALNLMTDLVIAIQMGDAHAYNDCFSNEYLQTEGPKGEYTKQKIYDVLITYVSENTEKGITTAVYRLQYKIRHNNGTFRNDMGSDGYREQTFVLSDASGEMKVKQIRSNDVYKTVVHAERIALVASVSLVLFVATVALAVIYLKKLKKAKEGIQNEEAIGG